MRFPHDPKILILDEPFNALDQKGIQQLKNLLSQWRRENKIILITSHSLKELDDLVDEIIVLDQGSVLSTMNVRDYPTKKVMNIEKYHLVKNGDSP